MMKTSTPLDGFLRELPYGARQCQPGRGIPFGVALLNEVFVISTVGEDGECPIQHAALLGARKAA